MEGLTFRTPATWTDCLDMGGSRAYTRKAMTWQRSLGESLAIVEGDEVIVLAFLVADREGRLELALNVKPQAARHMTQLCRFAHLTLARFAETGSVIVCHVNAGNRRGERMARLVGFTHAEDTLWIFSEVCDGRGSEGNFRRRRQRREGGQEAGGREPSAAVGLERSPACGAEP